MPYQRTLQFETAAVAWQDIVLLEAAPSWSDSYRAAGPRLLLPGAGAIGCELEGSRFVCDSLSGIWLTPAQAYRLRQPQARARSTVLLVNDDSLRSMRSRRASLPLSAHLQLARWRSALRRGQMQVPTLALEEALFALLHAALGDGADADPRARRAVERAREHLAAQPHHNDSLAQLATVACCSPFHLARLFRRHAGTSLHAYRTRLRMALALRRIEQGETHFATLAADLGYSSHSHFSAAFARHFGCPPSELRTNLTAPKAH
jgi:AraC family transcriptional regulator